MKNLLLFALFGFAVHAIPLKGLTHACLAQECEKSLCQCEALLKDGEDISLNGVDPLKDQAADQVMTEQDLHMFGASQIEGEDDLEQVFHILKSDGFQQDALQAMIDEHQEIFEHKINADAVAADAAAIKSNDGQITVPGGVDASA